MYTKLQCQQYCCMWLRFPCKCALKITNSYKKSHFLVLICFSADNDDDDEDEIVANDVTAEKSHREETSGRK